MPSPVIITSIINSIVKLTPIYNVECYNMLSSSLYYYSYYDDYHNNYINYIKIPIEY
jgi:hypothetical protein